MTHVSNSMKSVGKFFKRIGQNIQKGRQRTANIEIARMLQQTEYRRESVDTVYRDYSPPQLKWTKAKSTNGHFCHNYCFDVRRTKGEEF